VLEKLSSLIIRSSPCLSTSFPLPQRQFWFGVRVISRPNDSLALIGNQRRTFIPVSYPNLLLQIRPSPPLHVLSTLGLLLKLRPFVCQRRPFPFTRRPLSPPGTPFFSTECFFPPAGDSNFLFVSTSSPVGFLSPLAPSRHAR